jgi:hypothetical protein
MSDIEQPKERKYRGPSHFRKWNDEAERGNYNRNKAVPTETALRLRKLRKERVGGYSKLSEMSGIPRTTLANFEQGVTRSLSGEQVIRLAAALGMGYSELCAELGLEVDRSSLRLEALK